jgi:phosphatidylethanolamine/phosphatidyl-N-methylethanolamine N-methyltransferase
MKSVPKAPSPSKLLFLKQFLTTPFNVGSIVPSSKRVAQLMVSNLALQKGDVVVELGPGTGVFTRELLARGVTADKLILVEFNADFAHYLRLEFPAVKVIEGDAGKLPQILKRLGLGKVKHIVSGIPMRSLKPAQRIAITAAIASSLVEGGVVVQFTYVTMPPLSKTAARAGGLVGQQTSMALNNVPPAFVWRYLKT